MTERDEKKPIVLPCIAAVLCLLFFLLIGWASPVFLEMYRDFGVDPLPLSLRVISIIHWSWTLPLGGLVAAGLVWGSRHCPRKTTVLIDAVAIALAAGLFVMFIVSVFQPIFTFVEIEETAAHTSPNETGRR
jgi:hypothetical protein